VAELSRLLTGLLHGWPNDVDRTEGVPSVVPGDDLAILVVEAFERSDLVLEDGDVIVLAQKIVSETEGRSDHLRDVVPSRVRDVELGYVSRSEHCRIRHRLRG
jgi:F420-0:gamma-glutamyl ligase